MNIIHRGEDDNLFRILKSEHTGLCSAWSQERREEIGPKVYLPKPEKNKEKRVHRKKKLIMHLKLRCDFLMTNAFI